MRLCVLAVTIFFANHQIIKSSTLQIIRTADGSDTLFRPDLNQHYHSTYGAVQESQHIFIENGFLYAIEYFHPGFRDKIAELRILEVGFGTGLNALLTQTEAEKHGLKVYYTAIEAFPLEENYWRALNYPCLSGSVDYSKFFAKLHLATWNKEVEISPHFILKKIYGNLEGYAPGPGLFDLIYFDAFGPDAQPELWTEQVFRYLWNGLSPGGILVTYSVKGTVVRALHSSGFIIEKLPGPPGKRHVLRAVRI